MPPKKRMKPKEEDPDKLDMIHPVTNLRWHPVLEVNHGHVNLQQLRYPHPNPDVNRSIQASRVRFLTDEELKPLFDATSLGTLPISPHKPAPRPSKEGALFMVLAGRYSDDIMCKSWWEGRSSRSNQKLKKFNHTDAILYKDDNPEEVAFRRRNIRKQTRYDALACIHYVAENLLINQNPSYLQAATPSSSSSVAAAVAGSHMPASVAATPNSSSHMPPSVAATPNSSSHMPPHATTTSSAGSHMPAAAASSHIKERPQSILPLLLAHAKRKKARTLHVANLKYEATEADLRSFFPGAVAFHVEFYAWRGYAFVEFPSVQAAQTAITLKNGQRLLGRRIWLTFQK